MADDGKNWANAIPEMYFDVIGRIAPGAFLSLVILAVLLPDFGTAVDAFEKLEWGPSLVFLVLLLFASYAVGLLISPVGILGNRGLWRPAWDSAVASGFCLLQEVEEDLRLGFKLDLLTPLTLNQHGILYRHLHELLKIRQLEAKLLLPRVAAELSLALNFLTAFCLTLVLLALHRIVWYWPSFARAASPSPSILIPVVLLVLGIVVSRYAARDRTNHLVKRHFAYLAVYAADRRPPNAQADRS